MLKLIVIYIHKYITTLLMFKLIVIIYTQFIIHMPQLALLYYFFTMGRKVISMLSKISGVILPEAYRQIALIKISVT